MRPTRTARRTRARGTFVLALVLAGVESAHAQGVFAEIEPNETKAQATFADCLAANDLLTGSTQGTSTGTAGPFSADTFLVRTCALPPGIWKHRLTLTGASGDSFRGSIRGLDQNGTPGNGGVPGTMDVEVQATPFNPPRSNAWYGFGAQEQLYWRVTGATANANPYVATLSTSAVSEVALGPFVAGQLTITTVGQGHGTDTDLRVFDASFHAIPGFGNDDAWPPSVTQSQLVRTFTPGTYHLALARFDLVDDKPAAADDAFTGGRLLDFPGAVVQGVVATVPGTPADFAITDALGTLPVSVVLGASGDTSEIAWFRLEVGVPPLFAPFCAGDGQDPSVSVACPCANSGASGRGCANSAGPAGAALTASGSPSQDSVVLHASGMPATVGSIFLQGSDRSSTVFGDGVRCADGTLVRLAARVSAGGASHFPGLGDPTLSQAGGVVPGSGVRRYYQVHYRNAASFCTPATFNVTNGWIVDW